jgi:hypothetical protein
MAGYFRVAAVSSALSHPTPPMLLDPHDDETQIEAATAKQKTCLVMVAFQVVVLSAPYSQMLPVSARFDIPES